MALVFIESVIGIRVEATANILILYKYRAVIGVAC